MKKRKLSFTSVGGSSILTIFAVLCILVFALLSLSTAKANYNLAEKSVKAVSNYYAADTKAEEIYSQIRAGNMPDGVKQKGNTYSYTCAIDDKQKLLVEIKKQKEKFHVVKWEKQYTGEWKPDDTIDVWDGMEQMLPD